MLEASVGRPPYRFRAGSTDFSSIGKHVGSGSFGEDEAESPQQLGVALEESYGNYAIMAVPFAVDDGGNHGNRLRLHRTTQTKCSSHTRIFRNVQVVAEYR